MRDSILNPRVNERAWIARGQKQAGGSDRNLNAGWDVVDDAYGFAVRVSRQRVRDDVVLHLASWLVARLHAVDGFTGGTLQTEGERANR